MMNFKSPSQKKEDSQKGFTLVELMIVVAIIGVLAAVAVPNYQKYQSKARQSEAKIALAAMFTAEKAYYSENSTYSLCLNQMGYTPDGVTAASNTASRRYYTVGFNTAALGGATCGPTGLMDCNGYVFNATGVEASCATADGNVYYNATAKAGAGTGYVISNNTHLVTANLGVALSINQVAFNVGAAGQISTSTNGQDGWTINENKMLSNRVSRL